MNLKKIFFFLTIIFIGNANSSALTSKLDSLELLLSGEKRDLKKIDLLNKLFSEQHPTNYKKALNYAHVALKLSKELKSDDKISKHLVSQSANNVGAAYFLLDKYEKSLKYLLEALKLAEEINDTNIMSNALYNLGSLYDYKGDAKKGLQYLEQAIKLDEARGDLESAAVGYNSLAADYFFIPEYDKGMIYYEKAMDIAKPRNDERLISNLYGNRAIGLKKTFRFIEALHYHKLAISLYENLEDKAGLETAYLNIADLYIKMNENEKAVIYNKKSLKIALELNSIDNIMLAYSGLSESYEQMGDENNALKYLKIFIDMKDALYNRESTEVIAEMQTKYDTEKKEAENSLLLAEKKLDKAALDKKSIQQKVLILGLLLTLIIVGYIGYSLSQKKKINKLLNAQNEEISYKNKIIEEKNKDITDSINYAQRIQDAILPDESLLKKCYQSFIYYQPKDIVSGDFYWIKEVGNKMFFAVVDCTGHGVPGAFMSIIGANSLNKIVEDLKIETTGEILDELNNLVNKALGSDGISENEISFIRDGMDISICSIDKTNNKLEYSGANNSLYFLRNKKNSINSLKLIMENEDSIFYEIKPDKMAIGGGGNKRKYKTDSLELKEGDTIYLFSDGYADQFGGPKGKKFMYKSFKRMFLSIQDQNMNEQLIYLSKTMNEWKGDMEQLDDICVMGVRI